MRSEKVTFDGASGARLAARLDRPEGPVRGVALFAHCFTCSKDIAAARRIAGRLTAFGLAVLRFDFTGLGHSEGEFASTGFSSNVGDLRAAADWLAANGLPPQLLVGHSLGGAAVIAAAPQIATVRAVATIGAPFAPAHVLHNFGDQVAEIRDTGCASVTLAGREFSIARGFVEDVEAARLHEALAKLRAALLVLHAPRDAVVGIGNAAEVFTAARHPKSYISLDDADHLLTRSADADYAAELIAAWAQRYLDLADEPPQPDAPEGLVRVAEAEGLRQDISVAGRHRLTADEPASLGGTEQGPTPYQFLAAALGACTTMTLRMYARRKNFPLEQAICDVSHARCHAEDAPEGRDGRIDVFTRRIRLMGELDAQQSAALLAIADRCPVHRTLEAKAVIRTEMADPAAPSVSGT